MIACKDNKIRNPKTNHCISVNGALYKNLVKQGVVFEPNHIPNIQKEVKQCIHGEIINPKSKRCIKIGGALHKKLIADGVVFDKSKKLQSPPVSGKKITKQKCKNDFTFLDIEDVKALKPEDIFITSSGYCFSIDELIRWINSDAYTNINPYDSGEILFSRDDLNKQLNPELLKSINRYFENVNKTRSAELLIYYENLNIVYTIGFVGCVCTHDNTYSHNTSNSSNFEYSLTELTKLSEIVNSIKKESSRNVFKKFLDPILSAANKGETCIHGVGHTLLYWFALTFIKLESFYTELVYEPIKTGVIWHLQNDVLMFVPIFYRFRENNSSYFKHFSSGLIIKNIKKLSIFNGNIAISNIKKNIISDFTKDVLNESDMTTIDSFDHWNQLPSWRVFITSDGYCFDILWLIKVITNQINTPKGVNPFPQTPNNPFNRNAFKKEDLIKLRRAINNNYIVVSHPLMYYLENENMWKISPIAIVKIFETQQMRYVRELDTFEDGPNGVIDIKIVGRWEIKLFPRSKGEEILLSYLENLNPYFIRKNSKVSFQIPDIYFYKDAYSSLPVFYEYKLDRNH